jgi:hypothetical protein
MAVYWDLGLVARTSEEAEACAEYFGRKPLTVGGRQVPLDVSRAEIPDGWLIGVWPRGMSYASPRGDDAALTEESTRALIAATFDEWLREAPPFRAAYFGGEAYDAFLDDPLSEVLGPDGFEGLVVDTAAWEAMGRPAAAREIGAGRFAWARARVPVERG